MHTLSALACFPYLRHLSVTSRFTSETFSIVGKDNFKDEERFFPSLEELLLGNVTGVLALANLLSLIPPTALRTISVTYSLSQHPAKELRRLAENIALHPHICVLSLRSREPTVDAVKATDISILQNLKGLRAVYLDDVLSFTTAECGIFGLVQHWPDVRTVHIDCTAWREGGWGECRVFSLGILGDILYKCPRLEQFHAAMRAVDLPARAPSRVRQRYQGPLRLSVDITSSSFDLEPYDVAESLTSIRPGIEIICDGDALFVEEWRNKWIEVNKWAGRINATRAAEREGIESELLEVIGPEAEAQIVADAEDLS
ncbi:hypothetical protein PsYK624_105070 [Phanerochaete sordida]|uniref:Uncharacterized protein n=1 Tax=Phanerochaete sordida TaxID=48140 RepID=A0A9P3GDZ9_9APHY|nr:hypothetical protein PsYK624_105070 [Phanerochaete sordida]